MDGSGGQKIHVKLSEEAHRRLRVQVALENTTIQAYVERLVTDAVRHVRLPEDEP